MKTKYKYSKIGTLFLISTILGMIVGYTIAQSGNTFIISEGVYPHGVSYTFWIEAGIYYAKNDMGAIDYQGTNASLVFQNAINNLPQVSVLPAWTSGEYITAVTGRIYIKGDRYNLDSKLNIPLGSRITIEGNGITHQGYSRGVNGGTIINGSATNGILNAGFTLLNGTTLTGAKALSATELIIRDIEFQQITLLTSNSSSTLTLNGVAQGMLENVVVSTYQPNGGTLIGRGIELAQTLGNEEEVIFNRVEISGYDIGVWLQAGHINVNYLEIANTRLAIKLDRILANQVFRQIHIFNSNLILDVGAGEDLISFYGMYLEESGDSGVYYSWQINDNFNRTIHIYDVNSNNCSANLWTINNGSKLYFEHINVRSGSPSFPTVSTPSLVTQTDYKQNSSQLVLISIWNGATIDQIWINGNNMGNQSRAIYLYPSDSIKVNFASGSPEWKWIGVSAIQRNT